MPLIIALKAMYKTNVDGAVPIYKKNKIKYRGKPKCRKIYSE